MNIGGCDDMRIIIHRHCQKDTAQQERKDCARYHIRYSDPTKVKLQTIYFFGHGSLKQMSEWRTAHPTFKVLGRGFVKHMCEHCGLWHKGTSSQ